jgi:hypothetical protein
MSIWREKHSKNDGIGTCEVCKERKLLQIKASNVCLCHDCWLKQFECMDCKINTRLIEEYYTLKDKTWLTANPRDHGMLCIGCVEQRLGRALTQEDFRMEVPINILELNDRFPKSARLIDRISRRNHLTIII